jgi:hypothetical protein
MRKLGYVVLATGLVLAIMATNALAAGIVNPAPEISPTSLSTGLALLAGGVLLARARWRK